MKRNGKKRSFVKTMSVTLWLFWLVLLIMISVFLYNISHTLTGNAVQSMSRTATLGLHELSLSMAVEDSAVGALITKTEQLEELSSGDEVTRMVASQSLLMEMRDLIYPNSENQYLFVYNKENDTFLSRGFSGPNYYQQREKIREIIRQMDPGELTGKWHLADSDTGILITCRRSSDNLVGGAIQLDKWKKNVQEGSDWQFIMTQDGEIREGFGSNILSPAREDIPEDLDYQWIQGGKYLIAGRSMNHLGLYVISSKEDVLGGFETAQILLTVLIIAAVSMIAGFHFYARREVMEPATELVQFMSEVENGEYKRRLTNAAPNTEFETICSNLNEMLDTIVGLKMQAYEDRIQFDEATLKYVQLQIRPHFFLNALTTIHSMSFQGRDEDIRKYIESLSVNIRYLFKAGLHTVTLQEETEHVENYFKMQDMLYPNAVFSYLNIEEEAKECQVPQLIIHTLVENIYKHAVAMGRLTCILINATMEKKNGEIMCHIQVEDDGDGFPQDFLNAMEQHDVKVREDGHGVGLWNLTRTLQVMYQREDLISFSNKDPNGSRVDIWIPRKPRRQSSVWKL